MIIGVSYCFTYQVIYYYNVKLDLLLFCMVLDMKQDFFDYYKWRRDQKKNVGRSFTHGSALYDFLETAPNMREYWEIWEMIEQSVERQYSLQEGTADKFSYKALLELCDISELDEIANALFFNEDEDEDLH